MTGKRISATSIYFESMPYTVRPDTGHWVMNLLPFQVKSRAFFHFQPVFYFILFRSKKNSQNSQNLGQFKFWFGSCNGHGGFMTYKSNWLRESKGARKTFSTENDLMRYFLVSKNCLNRKKYRLHLLYRGVEGSRHQLRTPESGPTARPQDDKIWIYRWLKIFNFRRIRLPTHDGLGEVSRDRRWSGSNFGLGCDYFSSDFGLPASVGKKKVFSRKMSDQNWRSSQPNLMADMAHISGLVAVR